MAYYKYQAQDAGGAKIKGGMEAASSEEVLRKLKSGNLYPINVHKVRMRSGARGVKDTDIISFFQDLSGLIESGLPMDRALALASANQKNKKFIPALSDIMERVQKGDNLSDALAKYADIFGEMAPHLVKAGEISGMLQEILKRIADHMEQNRQFKQKLISSLVYPCILLGVSVLSIVVLLIFVIPKFAQIFVDMRQEIPAVTQIMLTAGNWLRDYFWVLPAIFFGLYLLWKNLYARPSVRMKLDHLIMKVPVLRQFFINVEFARYFRTLGILVRGGVPLLRAIRLVEKVIGNTAVKEAVAPLQTEVKVGKSLSWYFRKDGFFPQQVGAMLYIAEEQGRLADGLIKLGDRYQEDFQRGLERLTALAEPLVICFTGLFIGITVLSMFSAIFGVTDVEF